MTISRDSQREIARCKREMGGVGKGDCLRTYGERFDNNYPECSYAGCRRLKQKGSKFCATHNEQTEKEVK